MIEDGRGRPVGSQTRRQVLTRLSAATAVLACAATGALVLLPGGVASHTREVIARVYGPDIARLPAATDFCDAYDEFVRSRGLEGLAFNALSRFDLQDMPPLAQRIARIDQTIVQKFGMSTNVVRFTEMGGELIFVGLQHPYENTCINQVSSLAV